MTILEVIWIYCEGKRYSETGRVGFARDEEKAEELITDFKKTLSKSELEDYTFTKKEIEVR